MDKLVFDYSKLRGRIIEKYGYIKEFAKAVGIAPTSLSLKLNNKLYFSQAEIRRAIDMLDIEPGSVTSYFFTVRL